MQIFGAQYQSRRIRLLAALTFLLWMFVIPNGHVLYLMERREQFWRYHEGQWLNGLIGAFVVAVIIGYFKRPWGIIIFAFSALVILAPLVANASLPVYLSLPDVDLQQQQQYQEIWLKELMVAIFFTLICAAFWKGADSQHTTPTSDAPPHEPRKGSPPAYEPVVEVLNTPTPTQLPQALMVETYWPVPVDCRRPPCTFDTDSEGWIRTPSC